MVKQSLKINIMNKSLLTLSIFALICCVKVGFGQTQKLKKEIESIIVNKDVKLGFAFYDFSNGKSIAINAREQFPMQSVFKFPVGVALLECISNGEFAVIDTVDLAKSDLSIDLWSPIRERWPDGVKLPLSEVLTFMVAHSDNSATDLLINKIGGPKRVQSIITSLGAKQINIRNTEKEIQSAWSVQFDNWTTPTAMIDFLKLFNYGKLLNKENTDLLWNIMVSTSTGSFKRQIPETLTVAHKTGYSGANDKGVVAAQNDVGIIGFKDGRRVAFAIFLTDSTIGVDAGYDLIAQIAKAIYHAYQ